jgi:hypothetical protein
MSDSDDRSSTPPGILDHDRPLDSLLPELRAGTPFEGPAHDVHTRILDIEVEDGHEWGLICWRHPGDPDALTDELRRVVEATLLSWLSQPPWARDELERAPTGLQLFVYPELDDDSRRALTSLGFTPFEMDPEAGRDRLDALAEEARQAGVDGADQPRSTWRIDVERPSQGMERRLTRIQDELRAAAGRQVWGEQPGMPSKQLADRLHRDFQTQITPDRDGLRRMDLVLVEHEAEGLRWMPPLIFQALCDFTGIVAQGDLGLPVQWGTCEREPSGVYPPPLFRLDIGADGVLVPIGLAMLRWTVMPPDGDASVRTLDERVEELFVGPTS